LQEKRVLEKRDNEIVHLSTEAKMMNDRLADMEEEMEMKSGENNRLRKQVADLEAAM
jgi:cell division protein FtsL